MCVVRNKLGEITLYHGGTSLGTLTFAKDFISGDGELRIGELEGSRSYGFPGCLGHFNVWDIELSEATVASSAGGARTQVGNILGWPAVKQSIVGNIKVFSTSPVMKWTGMETFYITLNP